jgi:hypothetical protein
MSDETHQRDKISLEAHLPNPSRYRVLHNSSRFPLSVFVFENERFPLRMRWRSRSDLDCVGCFDTSFRELYVELRGVPFDEISQLYLTQFVHNRFSSWNRARRPTSARTTTSILPNTVMVPMELSQNLKLGWMFVPICIYNISRG